MNVFKLPDLGEGLPDAEIATWHVRVGDEVKVDEPLVSMETAKAIVDVPSPVTGKITKLYGKEGDVIATGAPLVEFESDVQVQSTGRDSGTVAGKIEVGNTVIEAGILKTVTASHTHSGMKATPAVRALAKKLNIALEQVVGTGPSGTITLKDVEQATQGKGSSLGALEPLKGVRRTMAGAMSQSHAEVVPVTVVDDAVLSLWSDREDITIRIIQALVAACQAEPALNAWFDGKILGRRIFNEVNLGIAMDSDDGLFVPVIRNVGNQAPEVIRERVNTLKTQVASRTVEQEALRGATITLSNFGKFSGRYANPIVVPPMVAIVGAGAIREEVVAINGEAKVSRVLPLSVTFDHRAVTGGEATRFLEKMIHSLEKRNP